ncbi:MAG: hypothetical protein PVJ27_01980 [Candidatus Brocadiaceae bacterium]|jgi:hypothetical protein
MSENITHTAVCDDCCRLILHDTDTCAAFRESLSSHHDAARLGGVTRWGDRFTVDLLGRYREAWPARSEEDRALPRKLAFVLGWLCHRAADRQLKPVFRATDPDCDRSPTDCSIYHDVFLFREVYDEGRRAPYAPAVLEQPPESAPAAGALNVAEIEELFRLLAQRALLALHTLMPDPDEADGWLERLFERRQRFRVDIGRYAEAFADPDPDKTRRFIEEINFYDPEEPLIRLARGLQHGEPVESVPLQEALDGAASGCIYARTVRRGCLYLRAANGYFLGRLEEDEVRRRLDIGEPGG